MTDLTVKAKDDLADLICGPLLGRGVARRVFEHALDRDLVVKVEEDARSFQNILEWEIWDVVKDGPYAKWFAPCRHISASGVVLLQDRVAPVTAFPARIPDFFTDLKLANFGKLRGKFVACDYGLTHVRLAYRGMTDRMRRIRKVDDEGRALPY